MQRVLVVLVGFFWATSIWQEPVLSQHRSDQFASQWVADAIGPPARRILGGDIRVIAGRQRLVSVLALRLKERPLVLINGRYELSPWLSEEMSNACGVLWVGGPRDKPPHDARRHEIGQGLWWAVVLLNADPAVCR